MVDARSAGPAFEVKDERRTGNKLHATAAERANDILWTMDGRVGVGFKIALRLKKFITGRAIVVKVRLTIVLVQTKLVDKDPIASGTIRVALFVVVLQLAGVVEMFVAILTIVVVRTLNPMFFEPRPGWKVLGATMADIVMRRIVSMSTESRPRSKIAVASFAIGHEV